MNTLTPEQLEELRDMFAAFALQGLLAKPNWTFTSQSCAEIAYAFADGMLAARAASGAKP